MSARNACSSGEAILHDRGNIGQGDKVLQPRYQVCMLNDIVIKTRILNLATTQETFLQKNTR